MRYSILGTTQAVRADGAAVAVGGPRLRALLTVLALRAGRTVPVAQLVAEVWDGDEPADATAALQALVGRLRRSLGHAAVESVDGGGYRLAAAPDDVDAHRFERLAGEGARALADGDPVKAAALLDEALDLWRGPALADLPDRTADAARLDARHLDARRARLAAALGLGRAEQTLPELTALCAEHPLDEPLQALRLRALRDAGRAAEALAAYEEVRAELAEQLGADPGAELRALHGELLAGSPDPAPADRHPGPRRPGPAATPGNLRTRLTSFVGREADIEALRGDLGRARLVTLLGPGGAGKTRLSQEAAETLPVPDGVWLAELAPVAAAAATTDAAAVPEAVLTALGGRRTVLYGMGAEELRAATDQAGGDPLVRLAEHCAPRRMLLLLDNCEHVVESAARTVEYLLAHCPQLTVLATSREPLGVPGELVRPLEPLPEPVALRLLADRGAAALPGFRIEDDPEACAEICRRLDGLPLAVELAAARLRSLTPRQIADRLDDRFRLLTSGSRTVLPRQQTLRAVVDWSWELLDARERAVLQRLSVFAGGCELDAAEAVCGGAPTGPGPSPGDITAEPACALDLHVDRRDVTDLMGSLVDKSLVVAAPSDTGTMRYRLLETVAEYAGAHLDAAGDRPAAEHAHLVHYRELARRADPELRTARQKQTIARIESEYENLRTALRRATDAGDEQEALCLVLSLCWYWQMRDLRSESRHWSTVVSALSPDPFAEPVEQAPPLTERCTAKPPPMVPEQVQEARRGARLMQLASMDHRSDGWNRPENEQRLQGIVAAYRPGLPQTCWSPGAFWVFAVLLVGRPENLRELLDRNVETCRAQGYRWELAWTLQLRANVLANRSAWGGDAERDATEALALFTELGDSWGAAEALSARGEAWERRGELAHAEGDFAAAIEHAEAIGAAAQVSVLQVRLAGIMLETGRPEQGEAMLWQILEGAGDTFSEAVPAARIHLTGRLGASGRGGEAREQLDLLWEQYFSGPAVMFKGVLHGIYGWLDILDGRHEEAYEHATAAFRWSQDPVAAMIAPHMASVQLALCAWALAGRAEPEAAYVGARLLGASDALLPSGHRPARQERLQRDTAEQAVRDILGDEAYERGHAEGGDLTLEEAAALL
ncbi:BTAD domain-containing putative transcriptional regulator [Streptomyces sp. LHD-70]|uniref:BTAD domain-containing putative transcriptional regulator n=1 Tax=Streptomyces sp. LHD-70 TaxID=3072140 RepID=UPI00280CE281|nr:BTAD domain-containing putative transcriptional regulator [Streptomyces sp. LHD-70]MDQ8701347.1 BTAD domain-containing putative transcriptional regulator [Streptomyces sp. LHD-70]